MRASAASCTAWRCTTENRSTNRSSTSTDITVAPTTITGQLVIAPSRPSRKSTAGGSSSPTAIATTRAGPIDRISAGRDASATRAISGRFAATAITTYAVSQPALSQRSSAPGSPESAACTFHAESVTVVTISAASSRWKEALRAPGAVITRTSMASRKTSPTG